MSYIHGRFCSEDTLGDGDQLYWSTDDVTSAYNKLRGEPTDNVDRKCHYISAKVGRHEDRGNDPELYDQLELKQRITDTAFVNAGGRFNDNLAVIRQAVERSAALREQLRALQAMILRETELQADLTRTTAERDQSRWELRQLHSQYKFTYDALIRAQESVERLRRSIDGAAPGEPPPETPSHPRGPAAAGPATPSDDRPPVSLVNAAYSDRSYVGPVATAASFGDAVQAYFLNGRPVIWRGRGRYGLLRPYRNGEALVIYPSTLAPEVYKAKRVSHADLQGVDFTQSSNLSHSERFAVRVSPDNPVNISQWMEAILASSTSRRSASRRNATAPPPVRRTRRR